MALREILSRLGIEVDTKKLDSADGAINRAKEGLSTLVAAYAGFKTVGAVVGMTTDMANQADQLQKTANAFGVSARSLAQWRYAAEQAGAETATLDDAVKTFSSKAYDALAKGSEDSQRLLRKLGITMQDLKTQTPDTLFDQAVIGFSKLENGMQKTGLGLELFGGSAEKLFDQFNQGAAGINAAANEFNELYGHNFEDHIRQSQTLAADMGKMDAAFTSVKQTIAHALMPVLNVLVVGMTRVARWFTALAKNTKIVEVGLIVLGAVAAAAGILIAASFAPVILTVLAIAAAIAAVVLIVEDLYVLFTGGNSAIGYLIEKAFGTGATKKFVSAMRAVGRAVKNFFRGLTGQEGSGALHSLGKMLLFIGNFAIDVFIKIAQESYKVWTWVAGVFKRVAGEVYGVWKGVWDKVGPLLEPVISAVVKLVTKLEKALDLVKELRGAFSVKNLAGVIPVPGLGAALNLGAPDGVKGVFAREEERKQTLNVRLRANEESSIPIRRSAREAPRVSNVTNNITVNAPNAEAAGAMVNRELRRSQERQLRAAHEALDRTPAR